MTHNCDICGHDYQTDRYASNYERHFCQKCGGIYEELDAIAKTNSDHRKDSPKDRGPAVRMGRTYHIT